MSNYLDELLRLSDKDPKPKMIIIHKPCSFGATPSQPIFTKPPEWEFFDKTTIEQYEKIFGRKRVPRKLKKKIYKTKKDL